MATAAKRATGKAQEATEHTQENVNSMITLGQDAANTALNSMVQTAQIANNTTQTMLNVGINAQEAGLNVARNYVEQMNRIGQEMIGMFSRSSERAINQVSDVEFAIQREVAENARETADRAEAAVDNKHETAKTATK